MGVKRMHLKRSLLLGFIIVNIMGCSTFMLQNETAATRLGKTIKDGNTIIYNSDIYDITIIGFKGNFEVLYDPQDPPSLSTAGQLYGYRYLINGSYFEGSRVHAGWLSVLGERHTPLKDDRQLSHMAVLDTSLGYLDFPDLELWDSTMTSEITIEFQTGPLVIHANQIDTLSIQASINGMTAHLRTFLAYTEEDGMKYFIITRHIGSLENVAHHLLSLPVFEGKTLFVMNLDGGSSTALYSRNHPELNFNTNRPLPILLGIR